MARRTIAVALVLVAVALGSSVRAAIAMPPARHRPAASEEPWPAPTGSYCGMAQAMGLVFDFPASNTSALEANLTVSTFGVPFPTCTGEQYNFNASVGQIVFPVMSAPIHTSPDCMVTTLQHVWITDFTLVYVHNTELLVLSAGGFSMELVKCDRRSHTTHGKH